MLGNFHLDPGMVQAVIITFGKVLIEPAFQPLMSPWALALAASCS